MTREEARIAARNAAYAANNAAFEAAYAVACDAYDAELARINEEYPQ